MAEIQRRLRIMAEGVAQLVHVHQRPPWTLTCAELVEQTDRVFASVAREVVVVAVDHGQAGAHVAGEVEGGDAGTEREGGEGVSEIVDPARRFDPDRNLRGLPLAVAEVVQVEVTAPLRGEHERGLATRWLLVKRLERDFLERDRSAARLCLRAFQATFREGALDVDNPSLQVDVTPFEREPFGRTKPSSSG